MHIHTVSIRPQMTNWLTGILQMFDDLVLTISLLSKVMIAIRTNVYINTIL